MKRFKLLIILFSVWTYGSESVDSLVDQLDYIRFMKDLGCWNVGNTVYCRIGEIVYGSDGSQK